ncbi:cysteine dioxygenase type 1 isoform X2 [Plodia interpunctella]|uniref:cysteine dioxygenase type 1 isoform X2 n=1 Tax=Plodia interpunctella TaxID=58824 RepID=UPI00236832FC|nr:cysteine dioxygenase type 1 isoform X2 [Plodia interpunctella]XP_053621639.1 cysteine dioxygenase type 1 isoform X2 [Plodia interpunctella]
MEVENANCKIRVSQCTHMEISPIEQPLKIDREITGLDKLVEELHRVFSNDHVNVQDVQKLMAGYKSNPSDWRKYAKFDRFRYTRNLVDAGNGAFNIMILCWGPGHASAIHDHADSHCFMKVLSGNLEEVRYNWPDNVEPEVMKVLKKNKTRRRCCSDTDVFQCQNGNCQNSRAINQNSNGKITENKEYSSFENGTANANGGDKMAAERNGDYDNKCEENDEEYEAQDMEEVGRTRLEVDDVCYINDALGLHRMENPSHVDCAVSLHLYCPPFDSCRVFDARTGKPTTVNVTFWSMYGKKVKRVMEASEMADSQ